MARFGFRIFAPLLLTTLLAAAWQPATAAAETRRRVGERAEPRDSRGEDDSRVDQAGKAAMRAGVDRRDVRELQELCERGDFSEAQTLRILSLAAQLALQELPVDSFAAKVGEGVSKHAAPDRIVQVAERRALHLNRAKAILNGVLLEGAPVRGRKELIPDIAEALEAGQTAEQLRSELAAGFNADESIGKIRQRIFP